LQGLASDTGERWEEVRRRLVPRYARVWGEVGIGYAALIGGFAAAIAVARASTAAGVAIAPLAAIWIGYWIAALVNFVHEAAHYNVHPDKRTNDRLANWLLCPLAGTEVTQYRELHWRHHLNLGTPADTEVSYRNRPDARFALRSLFGVQALNVLRTRRRAGVGAATGTGGQAFGLLRSAALHGGVVAAAVWAGLPGAALAWAMGAGMVYPFCNALRQTLEHRPDDAGASEGEQVGAANRLFATDPLSRSFGSAGFNRHLLHHWHPTVSYTCFDDLEEFLMRTPLAPALDQARTTYAAAWRRLAAG